MVSQVPETSAMLEPTPFVDSDHPAVIAFAREATAGAKDHTERASRLFRAVRERLRYDPYTVTPDPNEYRASTLLDRERSFCIPKAVLLCAAARASGIPARLGFADVKNHLTTEKLRRVLNGQDLFVWHGYVELWIDGRPVKATPAFNADLCARFGVAPLELDGTNDALLQPFDGEGRQYMEYVTDRGQYLDLPLDEILAGFASYYGRTVLATEPIRDEGFHGG
jgi:transglutaminase-like putative cysteine protease